jgi:hypothetical protein
MYALQSLVKLGKLVSGTFKREITLSKFKRQQNNIHNLHTNKYIILSIQRTWVDNIYIYKKVSLITLNDIVIVYLYDKQCDVG